MDQQMEGLHLDKPPAALADALGPRLRDEHPSSALVRLSLRLGLEPAYPLAASRAADPKLPAPERADFIRTLGELGRPGSMAPLLHLLDGQQPIAVRTAALLALQRYEAPAVAAAIIGQ